MLKWLFFSQKPLHIYSPIKDTLFFISSCADLHVTIVYIRSSRQKPVLKKPRCRTHRKPANPLSKKTKTSCGVELIQCFGGASSCSVTVMRPYSAQTQQQGSQRGEHACAFASVRGPQRAGFYDALVSGTEEQPCTLPEPCGDEFNMDAKAGAPQPSWARHGSAKGPMII